MKVMRFDAVEEKKIEKFPYKGANYDVKEVTVRWLSSGGPAESPEYGLRFFRVGPDGSIPIHNHFYLQTMYILTGRARVVAYDRETDAQVEEREVGPHEFVFIPSMEPHAIRNLSGTEELTFLCCIGSVYEDEDENV